MFKIIHESINSLNSNMFFAGIMMLTLNIGSRYVQLNLSPSAESYLKYAITKEFLVFTIAWMGTRNIYVALTLTAVFVVLADYAFNDKSNFCILPEKFKKLQDSIDMNNGVGIELSKSKNIDEEKIKNKITKWNLISCFIAAPPFVVSASVCFCFFCLGFAPPCEASRFLFANSENAAVADFEEAAF